MDLDTPGTRDTPERYPARALRRDRRLRGRAQAADGVPGRGQRRTGTSTSQIIEGPIAFQSLCEHHALPFHGFAHIGYIAGEQIIGISKLTRLVRLFARRFTVQERLGEQIADGARRADRAAGRRRAPRGVAPLHADARRRGALAHDHDVLARRLRGRRAAARVPARSAQQRPALAVTDVALVCGGSGVLGGALVEAFRRAATRSSSPTASPRSPGRRGDARGRRPDRARRRRGALGPARAGEPRWVVNAVGAFRGGPARGLGAGRPALPARRERRHRVVVVPRGGAAARGRRRDRQRRGAQRRSAAAPARRRTPSRRPASCG